jgi:hypothetical protein
LPTTRSSNIIKYIFFPSDESFGSILRCRLRFILTGTSSAVYPHTQRFMTNFLCLHSFTLLSNILFIILFQIDQYISKYSFIILYYSVLFHLLYLINLFTHLLGMGGQHHLAINLLSIYSHFIPIPHIQ